LLPFAADRLPRRETVAAVTRTVPIRVVEVHTSTGFDWGDAAIGAAAVLAVATILYGLKGARMFPLRSVVVALAAAAVFAPSAQALEFSPWSTAVNAESVLGTSAELNTNVQDGCPAQSPDRLSLYMASTRPGGHGGIDIWVAHRDSKTAPWEAPVNLPAPVNSAADDFCPTPIRGGGLFFVSRRVTPGVTCGMGDIYLTRLNPGQGWETPEHLGCEADGGPNTALDEQGPSYVKTGGPALYFSSGPDIYVSKRHGDGSFGPPRAVAELNTAAMDIQPNVRHDGREIVFASNRGGATTGQDIWTATRDDVNGRWSDPVNLGSAVNTSANETRPSLSWDGTTLYFGRAPGMPVTGDIFVSTREKVG
jgi:WD40-like Beta Propeller Repeat